MARKRTKEQNERAKRHYQELLGAGFSKKDAAALRYASEDKFRAAMQSRKRPTKSRRHAIAGASKGKQYESFKQKAKGWLKKTRQYPVNHYKGSITDRKNPNWLTVQRHGLPVYTSPYNYMVYYVTKDKAGNVEEKWLIYSTHQMIRSRRELIERLYEDIFDDQVNKSHYEAVVIKSSITLVYVVENERLSGGR